jgi:hypothetical protein
MDFDVSWQLIWNPKLIHVLLRLIFWVVPRRVVFNSRRFGTLCLFHLHIHSPMTMELIQSSETSAIRYHTPVKNPKHYTQHLEHSESLKSSSTRML